MKEKIVWEPRWWNFKLFWTEENTKIKESKHKFRLNKINSDLFTVSNCFLYPSYGYSFNVIGSKSILTTTKWAENYERNYFYKQVSTKYRYFVFKVYYFFCAEILKSINIVVRIYPYCLRVSVYLFKLF